MPKITVSKKILSSLLNKKFAGDLEKKLICAKAELDAEEDDVLKVELNDTNRPDLWTSCGLIRQIQSYHDKEKKQYKFFNGEEAHKKDTKKYIQVDPSVTNIRPYVAGFIISGKKITDEILEELIQIQEKLSDNFGQKRKTLAIGIYREDLCTWPILFGAEDPEKTKFIPLDSNTPQTLKNILATHPKGKEYGVLLQDYDKYPILRDSAGEVLSMPPIINSAFLGSVKVGDEKLFIECTGDSLETLLLASNIFACDCTDLGFDVERVETRYTYLTPMGKEVIAPQVFQSPTQTTKEELLEQTKILLGLDEKTLDFNTLSTCLQKMNVTIKEDGTQIEIILPPYRNDFLHLVDVIEDVLIGYGLENLSPQMPKSFTMGQLHPDEKLSRRVISTMVGLGFQEMLFSYFGNTHSFVSKMYSDEKQQKEILKTLVQVSNPLSENYETLRPSALPYLLESERVSANSPYPHKICEIGKVVVRDKEDNYGSCTKTMLSFLIANATASFTEINSVVAAVLYYEDVMWRAEAVQDGRFIKGRVAKIIREKDGITVGVFGEVHPWVLQQFDITMPCVAGEICLDLLNTEETENKKQNDQF